MKKTIFSLLLAIAACCIPQPPANASDPRNVDGRSFGQRVTLGPDWHFAPGDNTALGFAHQRRKRLAGRFFQQGGARLPHRQHQVRLDSDRLFFPVARLAPIDQRIDQLVIWSRVGYCQMEYHFYAVVTCKSSTCRIQSAVKYLGRVTQELQPYPRDQEFCYECPQCRKEHQYTVGEVGCVRMGLIRRRIG